MYQTKLKRVGKVLPKYLPRIARERDGEGLLKIWLLDDLPSASAAELSPLHAFLRSYEGRRWLDETTGNLIQVYVLDPAPSAAPEERPQLVEVLSRRMPYTLAVHRIAELFGLDPERLPALVGYISLEHPSYCVHELAGADDARAVKQRLTAILEALKSSARGVLGSARVDDLLACRATSPITVPEGLRIAEGMRERFSGWSWRAHSGGMAAAIEKLTQIITAVEASSPDLVLLVRSERRDGGQALCFELEASDPGLGVCYAQFGPLQLASDPATFFDSFFRDVEELSGAGTRRRLEARGAKLFKDLLPAGLREQLWALLDRVETFQILSDEPWIPWELLKFQGRAGDPALAGPFFGEAFALTRWLRGLPKNLHLPSESLALVLAGDDSLPSAVCEHDYLKTLAGPRRRIEEIPATYDEVVTALASGRYDGWHFTGHGHFDGAPDRWSLLLADGEELTPDDLAAEAASLGRTQPLVFLNACQTGRGGLGLAGPGGWARELLAAGAGAFLGSIWRIPDAQARDFAEAFYSCFYAGTQFGEAVRQARLTLRDRFPEDPTWLAYTAFAHPMASCRTPP